MSDRLSWDAYFMGVAAMVAGRSTCPRKHVGAVLVREHSILSTGYNGSVRGLPHCTEVGCLMEDNHCVATLHAEANAIVQSARHGVMIAGAECYVTASPCWSCFKMLANAGVRRIAYGEFYRDDRVFDMAGQLDIVLDLVSVPRDHFAELAREVPPTLLAQTDTGADEGADKGADDGADKGADDGADE